MAEVEKPLGQSLDDPRRALVNRVAASEPFAKSPRLRELFTYLAECALRDPHSSVTEQQVGVAVFNRSAGYDTSSDTVVRVQASEVRKRLKYYFLSEGLNEPLLMELPRGSYLPIFSSRELPTEDAVYSNGHKQAATADTTPREGVTRSDQTSAQRMRKHLALFVLSGLLTVAVAVCAWLAYQNNQLRKQSAAEAAPLLSHFWKQFFQNSWQTEVVPSDFDLIVISDVLGRNVPLKEYSSEDYPKMLIDPLIKDPKINNFVSKAARAGAITEHDGPVLNSLALVSERFQIPFQVKSPRQARVDQDYGNFILLGHERANPWVEMFESRMNFRHYYDDTVRKAKIINISPQPGEKPEYVFENFQETYAVVACLPRRDGKGNVLILYGITLANIDGAAHLVTDEAAIAKLYSRLGIGPSDHIPYFEVLLEEKPDAQNYEIIAHRIISNP
jgi:hypothetical protein